LAALAKVISGSACIESAARFINASVLGSARISGGHLA
jgi:hypothetical protein